MPPSGLDSDPRGPDKGRPSRPLWQLRISMPIPAPRSRPARIPTGLMRAPSLALLLAAFAALVLALPAAAQDLGSAPEAATDAPSRTLAFAERHMVSAANRYAADAGREILRAGGSAVDAAIAVQLVLNLVEPQSSGLGGGSFVFSWAAGTAEPPACEPRETAPASSTPD